MSLNILKTLSLARALADVHTSQKTILFHAVKTTDIFSRLRVASPQLDGLVVL